MWQNVDNEVLLAWFKFQAKIPTRSGACLQGEWQKYTPPSTPLSKDEGLKNTGHSMSIRNPIFGVSRVTVSYFIRYDSLLQNATGILLQNATVLLQNVTVLLQNPTILLQNATVITICDAYCKLRQYRDKM